MANSKSELPGLNPEFYLNFIFCANGRVDLGTYFGNQSVSSSAIFCQLPFTFAIDRSRHSAF
jgi:hypothetical protein